MDTRRAKSDVLHPSSKSWSTATLKRKKTYKSAVYFRHISLVPALSSMGWNTNRGASLREQEGEEEEEKISAFSQRLDLISVSAGGCVFWLSVCNTSTEQNSSAKQLHKSALISESHVCHVSPPCCDSTCPHRASLHGGKKTMCSSSLMQLMNVVSSCKNYTYCCLRTNDTSVMKENKLLIFSGFMSNADTRLLR